MKVKLVTYGTPNYRKSLDRLVSQAESICVFDEIRVFTPELLSDELKSSVVIKEKRGGGLWSWKPDILFTTMQQSDDGDIIVYCDAGCSVYKSNEWNKIFKIMEDHDLLAQRIFARTEQWTRIEIMQLFEANGPYWGKCYQYQATMVIKNSAFSRRFVKEWRDLMIMNPLLVMDVSPEDMKKQLPQFIENRHDQALYSALVYKYLKDKQYRPLIATQWEHIEDYDPIFKQAIRATRLRNGENESIKIKRKKTFKRLVKDYILRPFFYSPANMFYSLLNGYC